MQYLGSKRKSPLWPDDAKARADIMRWQSWHLQHWSRGVTPYLFENLVKPIMKIGEPDQKALAAAGRNVPRGRRRCSTSISSGHAYLVDDALTLADFTVAAPLFLAERGEDTAREVRQHHGAIMVRRGCGSD